MIQTLNPYSTSSKTEEILSRYRPIAPKPELPINSDGALASPKTIGPQSPYLRNIWAHLQARPTRTRKRGRTAPVVAVKRQRTSFLGLCSPSPAQSLSVHGFARCGLAAVGVCGGLLEKPVAAASSMVTLPLLSSPMPTPTVIHQPESLQREGEMEFAINFDGGRVIDLNRVAGGLEEKDLVLQLELPTTTNVIAPQPIRPIGSSISVGCISEDFGRDPAAQVRKRPEEVEEEVEAEALPAIISDSKNKVRMANSAYKEMVGQPECPWLDSMVRSGAGKRIGGEVVIRVSKTAMPVSPAKGFSCWARIEWESDGKKRGVNAWSEVVRLWCDSKDYLFTWRFHTGDRRSDGKVSPPGAGV
ncbi:hypothetical protein Nepgr_019824 [Nepenthes gracilis]|uniref:DUF7950 domain-containing protein n=1 Tax=Nepenthes gracilis TaxID=150966 RepID=A0AAD3XUR3_NEPGR|nr:hypothetical protein Nepgr_019824 [Nepenthes gracilis]